MAKVVGAFLGAERIQERTDPFPCVLDRSLFGLSGERLQLCEHHFDGIEVRTVGRKEEQTRTDRADGVSNRASFVTAQIIENDDIARGEGRRQEASCPQGEGLAIDGAVEDERSDDPIAPQTGQKG